MVKNLFLIALLLLSIPAFSQFTLIGKLIDKDTNAPIDYGYVILYLDGKTVNSVGPNSSGEFYFVNLTKGNYRIEIKILGYADYKTEVELERNKDLGTIPLSVEAFELEGVSVVRQKQQVIYMLDKKIISVSSDIIASGGGTATDLLSKVPSIRVDADGNVSFRGSSGFIVQVNGKPSMFNAAQALQQIPASQIENIEIITTPSARNQTDGDVGIINIITRQNYGEGVSGAVNIFGSSYASRGLDFTLNKQSGEHQFKLNGYYGQRFRKSDFEQEKTTIVADTSTTSHSKGPRQGEYYNYILQAGWQLTKKQTDYYIDLTGGYEGWANKGNLQYAEAVMHAAHNPVFNEYNSKDNYDLYETIISGSTGFNHQFKKEGHTLKGHFYAKYGGNAMENFRSDLYSKDGVRQQGHEAWEDEFRWTVDGRLDYILPYSKTGRIETGYRYFSYLEDGDYKMEYWNPAIQQFDYRDDIYNTFYFQQGIHSLYLLANQRVGKIAFQGGIRAEHTHQVLRSSKEWANRTQNRLEFFPSAHIGYYPDETSGFTAAYSRRTNRPELFFMEPYITFRDYYTAEIGNPDIRPEYINSYEISFKKSIKEHSMQIVLFHRSRTDKIERLRVPYEVGITLDSMANVGSDYSSGVELGLHMKPLRIWDLTLNGNVFHYKVKNKLALSAGGQNVSSTNYGVSLYNNIKLGKNTVMQLDGSYIGPTVRTQGRQEGFFYADFGIRQRLFEKKLSVGLSFRNFLNTAKYKSSIDTYNLVSHTTIIPEYPLLTLNLGYTFNNFKQRTRGREGSDFFEGTNY